MGTRFRIAALIVGVTGIVLSTGCAHHFHPHHDFDHNPPGPLGGPGTNWENPPGPAGGLGASPDRRHRR